MKIINALGGGGSSFVLRALDRENYRYPFGIFDPYPTKVRLEKYPALINWYNLFLRMLGGYHASLKVLKRPDSFWTDWRFHEKGIYDPADASFQDDLRKQREYIIRTRHARSAGLRISAADISTDSLASLVRSYIDKMEMIESRNRFTIVLVAGHWGEYGILKELNIETIYVIREPFNSLISHSKNIRHEKDYLRRGLDNINTKEWIDCYLKGPHHYWVNHAQSALEHENAIIVRYNHFAEDWKKIHGLPDVSPGFVYKENDVARILTRESMDYIYEKPREICQELELDVDKYFY